MVVTRKTTRDSIFRYYGAKSIYCQWLYKWFPSHTTFVDVFGGGGSVTLNKVRSPLEVYNDIDPAPVNFYRQLVAAPHQLITALKALPPTLSNFQASADWQGGSEVDRAARFFLRQRASFSGESIAKSSYGFVGTNRHTKVKVYWNKVAAFPRYSERFGAVTIHNQSFDTLIPLYDDPDTLVYCDPPYNPIMRTNRGQRCYRFEMTESDHERLCGLLLRSKAMVVLSGYDRSYKTGAFNTTYNDLLKGWGKVYNPCQTMTARWTMKSVTPKYREECLWINPLAWEQLEKDKSL